MSHAAFALGLGLGRSSSGSGWGAGAVAVAAAANASVACPARTRAAARVVMAASPDGSPIELLVDAASRQYPILFADGLLNNPAVFQPHLTGDKILIVTNTTIAPLYLNTLKETLAQTHISPENVFSIQLPDGEEYKSLDTLSAILDACMSHRLDRKSTLIALGGGVVGDITGFAAAIFVRGIPFIQVPTTLLAVVDSAVGGKTAVNHTLGKNMIGAFYQPRAVVVDPKVLATLDDRQLSAGIAEVVKYGLIRDAPFFLWCEDNMDRLIARDPEALQYAMEKSCMNKAAVVKQDEMESGVRATLNLGHTFGHAIEASTGYGQWLHGEAVAAGMVMACEMSVRLGWLDQDLTDRTEKLLLRAELPIRPPPSMTLQDFMMYMSVDKKVESGVMKLVLLKGLGDCVVTADFPEDILFDTIMSYSQKYKESPETYNLALGELASLLEVE